MLGCLVCYVWFVMSLLTKDIVLFVCLVVILAEDKSIQEKLQYYDLKVQTVAEVAPVQVYAASFLAFLFSHLGEVYFFFLLSVIDTHIQAVTQIQHYDHDSCFHY